MLINHGGAEIHEIAPECSKPRQINDRRLSVAPMLDWTYF